MSTETSKGRAPTHAAYQIRHYTVGREWRSHWTSRLRLAAQGGAGFNVQLRRLSVNDELTILRNRRPQG